MANTKVNTNANVVEEIVNPTIENVETTNVESTNAESYQQIINKLIAAGAKKYNNIKIKNVNVLDNDTYVRVSLTIVPNVPAYINETLTESNVIFTSLFALVAVLKNNEETAWAGNTILERPNVLPLILCGATINILQRHYDAGDEVPNPFSTRESEPRVYDHNIIVNDIIDIKLGKTGQKMMDKLADKVLGF